MPDQDLYEGDHLPNQTTFLDIADADEDAPVFDHHHDIAAFTSDGSARFSLESVSYSAEKKRLAACNGRTLITVPVDRDGLPDMLIDGEALHKAIKDSGPDGVQCEINDGRVLLAVPNTVTRLATQGEGKFPDVYSFPALRKRWRPDLTLSFSPEELELVVKYAKKIKAKGIQFGMVNPGESGQVRSGVRFTFTDTDETGADVVGIIMPRAGEPWDDSVGKKAKDSEAAEETPGESEPEENSDPDADGDDLETRVLAMSNAGHSMRQIATELGISRHQVAKYLGKE